MSKAKLTASEWEMVKDAPYWVEQALAAAEKKSTPAAAKKEAQALEDVRKGYKTSNALVRDIMADQSARSAAIAKASKADADIALGRIAAIVESKLGGDDLDALNDFLLEVGERIAGAAKENVLGLGDEVSKKETATLKELAVVLRATDAQKKARREQAHATPAPQPAAATQATHTAQPAREDAAAKARKEAEARHEAEAKAKQAAEAKARQEADDKSKSEAKARLEKAREEAEERRRKLDAEQRLEKAREEAEARQKETLAKRESAKAEEERAVAEAAARETAAKEAAAASRFKEFIAEHTVMPGENLSFISQKYYGTQANFRLIYEANKDVIGDNMNLIRPGQKLRIPKL